MAHFFCLVLHFCQKSGYVLCVKLLGADAARRPATRHPPACHRLKSDSSSFVLRLFFVFLTKNYRGTDGERAPVGRPCPGPGAG